MPHTVLRQRHASSGERTQYYSSGCEVYMSLFIFPARLLLNGRPLSNTIPPPACRQAISSLTFIVRNAMQAPIAPSIALLRSSDTLSKPNYAIAPAYSPLFSLSSSAINFIASTLGAPLTTRKDTPEWVPASLTCAKNSRYFPRKAYFGYDRLRWTPQGLPLCYLLRLL